MSLSEVTSFIKINVSIVILTDSLLPY